MADSEIENIFGVTDKRRTLGQAANNLVADANYVDVAALRARLTAINAVSYSVARLNTMTKNDMVYAVRLNDDLAGI
jgi:hypothetical protein